MRRINARFHVEGDQIVKTSNGQLVPPEEPLFLVRGRDRLAVRLLEYYAVLAALDGCNIDFLRAIDDDVETFRQFAVQYYDRMKQPDVTRGK